MMCIFSDFSANNLQTVNSGVPISVPAASSSSSSDISADNINTIAIENKLFDTNMPGGNEINAVGASPSFPNTAVDQPIIDSALPIGEQIMKQLPVPNELVNALTGGTNDNSQNMFSPDTMLQSDQRFSPNNVRDGLILDSMSASVQDIPNDNSRIDLLSAPSLDRLASSIPMGDILTAPQNMQNTIAANNNDPTIMKIANILPQADRNQGRGGSKVEMPSLSMDAKGFSTEGKFNTIQRGFNNPTRLSSKNGIDIQMNITPHFTSRTEANSNNIKTSQRTHTANIQTDGSFLGSASPVPKLGAGQGLSMWDSNDPMFYDQASLLGSISGTLTPSSKQQLPVDIPLPPPQIDTTAPAVTVAEDKLNSTIAQDGIKAIGTTKPDNFQEPVSFTSAVDAPITTFVDPNIAPPTGSSSAGAIQNEFGSIENNPNWAVFDPTAFTMDLNFADINPIITGINEPAPDVAFVNTNDIKFTNAFDVTPMKYEPTPSSPTSSPSTTPKVKSTPVVEATPVSKVASDVVNINTPEKVNTQTITANKPLNDRGAKFEEVVIAPLPFSPSGTGQTSVDLPPPPPIFK